MERLSRFLAVIALLGGLAAVAPVARGVDTAFGTPTATAVFGESVTFEQPITTAGVSRAEILVDFPGSIGPRVTPVTPPPDGTSTLRHSILLAEGHLYPDTHLTARWRLTLADGSIRVGPEVAITYADDRFEWQTAESDHVRVFWYEGDAAFGRRALRVGEDAIANAEQLLGVDVTERVDFFVYADQDAFYDALGPGARENVGGSYIPGLRILFALITPAEIDDAWVGIVIPHELTHLVFDEAVDNPYHFPPRWLNEGLAVYLTQGYDASDRQAVEAAAKDGTLIPLDGLLRVFPTTREGFFLAYSESVSAIDYLIRTYGQDALVGLIRSYAEGRTDDEAFRDALGIDTAAFNAAWFGSVEATVPDAIGPQPAPPGPLPPGWSGSDASPSAGSTGQPAPAATATPAPDPGPGSDGAAAGLIALAVAVLGVAAVVGLLVVRRRRPPRGRASTAPPPSTDTPPEDDASHDPNA